MTIKPPNPRIKIQFKKSLLTKTSFLLKKLFNKNVVDKVDLNIVVIDTHTINNQAIDKLSNDFFVALLAQMKRCEFNLNKPNLMSMILDGDNMEPTYYKNDIVIIDLDNHFSQEGLYAVRIHGELSVFRVQAMLHGYRLINDNPKYDNILITANDNFSIVGHLEWALSKTNYG